MYENRSTTLGGIRISKSKYRHIKKNAEKILKMKTAGYKKRAIAKELEYIKEQGFPVACVKNRPRRKYPSRSIQRKILG